MILKKQSSNLRVRTPWIEYEKTGGIKPPSWMTPYADFNFEAEYAKVSPGVLEVSAPSDRLGDFTVVRASDASHTDSSGVIQTAPDNVARIDYTNGVAELLTETQSTNLIDYSEDFSDASWIYSGTDKELSNVLSPNGIDFAYRVFDVANGFANVNKGIDLTGYNKSIWARTVSGTGTINLLNHNSDTNALFTITEEWQRFDTVPNSESGEQSIYLADFRSGTLDEILVWGAQLEALPYATSYIPTNGSTVTRLQDEITDGGNVNVINSEEGVLFFEGSALVNAPDDLMRIGCSDGTNNNRVLLIYQQVSNRIEVITSSGGPTQASIVEDLSDTTANNKIAFKWKVNDFALWVNGVELGFDASGAAPVALSMARINFTDPSGAVNNFFGRTRELKVYDRALTDEELEQITTL